MKSVIYTAAFLLLAFQSFAQADTTRPNEPDTIKVGNFIIIKKNKSKNAPDTLPQKKYSIDITIGEDNGSSSSNYNGHSWHRSNISTNWLIFDLGFANWRDKTVYGSPEANAYLHAAPGEEDFTGGDLDLRNTKSSNVNIWLFMQKLNITKHVVNLKYGIGLEMYNYKYSTNITYKKSPDAYIFRDTISFSKNKLMTGYVTVPVMLNIDPFPNRRRGLSFSVGVSAGYLYNSHTKQISNERGKQKIRGDIGIDPWRIAYIAEAGLGPIRLYGSYSTNPLHENGLKQYPYAIGLRFSNW
ncbi:outer membrane beta-barrel protein [Panacibacter ginsenosidivorans]|uniref:Outer membrane beta-barrel protein n=1 Tax=Panacibacter ginsenosidivorans TaxID=1813871 RepID=A0A5B8VAS3_9BACT|nr:outer membrane beta-barrel protein [Panacibacter ginsenosidivorans]QEC67398.1 outer membrane beta-barrel protein [Panacibacter ginsenosidivorans]